MEPTIDETTSVQMPIQFSQIWRQGIKYILFFACFRQLFATESFLEFHHHLQILQV
jgi:hypothetical protein